MSDDELRSAVRVATERLLERRRADGSSLGCFEYRPGAPFLYLVGLKFLGLDDRFARHAEGLTRELFGRQLPSGAWSAHEGGDDDVSITLENYLSLVWLGVAREDERMLRARDRIGALGGVDATSQLTRFALACLGEISWDDMPGIAVETVQGPLLYAIASYARAFLVPLAVLSSLRATSPVERRHGLGDLPRRSQARTAGDALRRVGRALEVVSRVIADHPLPPLRRRGLDRARAWIEARVDEEGGFCGILPTHVFGMMALRALGHSPTGPVLSRMIAALERLVGGRDGRRIVQLTTTELPDTAYTLMALAESGAPPALLEPSAKWIYEHQVTTVRGEWHVRFPEAVPGGWACQAHNPFYADPDDTGVATSALLRGAAAGAPLRREAIARALAWMQKLQCDDGAWAAYEPGSDYPLVRRLGLDDVNGLFDPPAACVTGRVLEGFARFGDGAYAPTIARALRRLEAWQSPEGTWEGRCGVNHLYGVFCVLEAMGAAGAGTSASAKRAAQWLRTVQNEDGGWGETPESYHRPSARGRGPSTPTQTAWALLALLASDAKADEPAVERGLRHLLETQRSGAWSEAAFTGTAMPGVYFIRYELFPQYFPLTALGRALRARNAVR